MANTDSRGNILGSNGMWKVIVGASLAQQVLPPTNARGTTYTDATLGAGGQVGQNCRPVRVLVTASGSVSLYDSINGSGATTSTLIWTAPSPAVGSSTVIDCPTAAGLWVVTGAGAQITLIGT